MQLQFPKIMMDHLKRVAWEIKNEEQTQEVKLSDAMPDIGRILGTWGQVILRGKEWRGTNMTVTGGVMMWVLYAPEDGSEPRSVESWIPFQMRWDFPQTQRDGMMIVDCALKSVDARSISPRKLLLRSIVSAAGEALEPVSTEIFVPGELPEDVQVHTGSYPVRLLREAGEKTFTLDEEFQLPANCTQAKKLFRCAVVPMITDQKIMADKAVFRGTACLHCLVGCEDGRIQSCDFEMPFSQYAELQREYDPYASLDMIPAVTNLEPELLENGMLRLKAGLVGQYRVYDRPVIQVVEDAYSVHRPLTMQLQELNLPAVLETQRSLLKAEKSLKPDSGDVMDIAFTSAHPSYHRENGRMVLEVPGSFYLLNRTTEGNLQGEMLRWEGTWETEMRDNAELFALSRIAGKALVGVDVACDLALETVTVANTGIPMVTMLELGEPEQPDPNRPSLILRRAGDDTLWKIAKECGTTVQAIREANALTEEPTQDQMLLIPVP